MINNKIKTLKELKRIAALAKRKKQRLVFTNGCFDIIHPGHIKYLEKAKSLGDELIVAVNSNASVRKIKGRKRPIFGAKQRAFLVAACQCVDFVTIFSELTPLKLIRSLRPQVLAKGADWKKGKIVGKDFVESYGGCVRRIKFEPGYSTSAIIAKIKESG
ncbi:D-glycero-beta-D-manno-heptose 1-phosphate adenylyltransferase [Candidatus Omnitrophota bacterium]